MSQEQATVELDNRTHINAELFCGSADQHDERLFAEVICKAIGYWDADGRMTMAWSEETPVLSKPMPTPWGDLPADRGLRKTGCDIVALGRAYHPDPEGGPSCDITVAVDDDVRSLRAFGERWWQPCGDSFRPSKPEVFVAMDLCWSRSYGGQALTEEGEDAIYVYNPRGRGYITAHACAEDENLPNFEDPKQLIERWDDQPRPCNIATIPSDVPLAYHGRAHELAEPLTQREQLTLPPDMGNVAHPNFQFSSLEPGQRIHLSGMTPDAPLELTVPRHAIDATTTMGDRCHRQRLQLVTLTLLPELRCCLMTWKAGLGFEFRSHEHRELRLDIAGAE